MVKINLLARPAWHLQHREWRCIRFGLPTQRMVKALYQIGIPLDDATKVVVRRLREKRLWTLTNRPQPAKKTKKK